MTQEELQAIRLVMREEIGAAISASEQRVREEISTAISASEQRTGERLDKIETRMGHVEIRVARMDGRMDQLAAMQRDLRDEIVQVKKEMMETKTDHREAISVLDEATKAINSTQAAQRALEIKNDDNLHASKRDTQSFQDTIKRDTQSFQDIIKRGTQDFQDTLKTFQDNLQMTRGYVQMLQDNLRTTTTGMNKFALDFIEMNRITNERLTYHENSPLDETHPRPPRPDTAA